MQHTLYLLFLPNGPTRAVRGEAPLPAVPALETDGGFRGSGESAVKPTVPENKLCVRGGDAKRRATRQPPSEAPRASPNHSGSIQVADNQFLSAASLPPALLPRSRAQSRSPHGSRRITHPWGR